MLRAGILKLQLAKHYTPAFPPSARNYFRVSAPGWCWDRYADHALYIDDVNLANILPISGSGEGALDGAEALYDGANGGLVGLRSFRGERGESSPSHLLVTGMTGCGKSFMMMDLLSQALPYFPCVRLVDEGNSYGSWVSAVCPEAKTLVLKSGGDVTLNYLDSQGGILDPEQLSNTVSVAHLLAGTREDGDDNKYRRAILARSLSRFYLQWGREWIARESGRARALARLAAAAIASGRSDSRNMLEVVSAHWGWRKTHGAAAAELEAKVPDADVDGILAHEGVEGVLVRLSCGLMSAAEAPIHRGFVSWLQAERGEDRREREELQTLVKLLGRWNAEGGEFGRLFDGFGNVDLTTPVVHLELGMIKDTDEDLRAIAPFIVTNFLQRDLVSRSRAERKCVVLEELGSFLSIPGGATIGANFFRKLRKHGAWCVAVTQQLDQLMKSGAASAILGNCRLGILLKQRSEAEAAVLAEAFGLPPSVQAALTRLSEPSRERGSEFLLFDSSGPAPVVTRGWNAVHPEMHFLASSNGDHFERRAERLRGYDSVIDGVIEEAARQ